MFINCPFCKSLVATDPATDLPPERCPRCAARLRELTMDAPAPPPAPYDTDDTPGKPVFDLLEIPTPDALAAATPPALPASGLATQIHEAVAPAPIAPIATLLRPRAPEPEAAPEAEPQAPAPAATDKAAAPDNETAPTPATQAFASDPATPPTPAEPDAAAGADTPADAETAAPPVADTAPADTAPVDAPPVTDAPRADADADADADAADATAQTTPPPAPAATRALPSFARRRRSSASGFDRKSGAAIAGLALLLVLQLLLADRAHLAADARWRPLLANVCGVLGCSLPPWREPDALRVLARDVRPHPSMPGVLRVTATFRNDARWTQPWPRVRLTLSDVNGRAMAARDFDAADYLGDAAAQPGLRSGQSASIAMDIREPAARSVAFDFELH